MGIMHPTRVSFGRDDVVWFWCVAYQELGASYVHHGLRWFLCSSHIFISRALTTLDLVRSPEYHLDLFSFKYMAGISP